MAKKIVKLTINDEHIVGSGVSIGAAGSHDETLLQCTFSDLWDGTTKRVYWRNALGEDAAVTVVTPYMDYDGNGKVYSIPVPYEAKQHAGTVCVTIKGFEVDEATKTETVSVVASAADFRVLQSHLGVPEADKVTPSVAEQLQAEIDKIKRDNIKNIPKLADWQKKQMVDLMNQYYRVRKALFFYTGAARRECYAYPVYASRVGWSCDPEKASVYRHKDDSVFNVEGDTRYFYKYVLNCGLFCQMIWMGRPISDFIGGDSDGEKLLMQYVNGEFVRESDGAVYVAPKNKALQSPPKISQNIHSVFKTPEGQDWGYYFVFEGSRKAYKAVRRIKEDGTVEYYSYNTHTNPNAHKALLEMYPDAKIPLGFDGAGAMAEELYRIGCEIPPEEMDIGDLVFYTTVVTDENELVEKSFRDISHVGVVYNFDEKGAPIIMDCTSAYGSPVSIGRTSVNGDRNFYVAKSVSQYNSTVMVARHPAAFGLVKRELTVAPDGAYILDDSKNTMTPPYFKPYRGVEVPETYGTEVPDIEIEFEEDLPQFFG